MKLLADGVLRHNPALAMAAGAGLAVSAVATWFLKVTSDRDAAPVPRPRGGRARIPRRGVAGFGGDHRASRTSRIPRPPRDAARSGFRAGSHVHVVVLDVRMDSAAGRDGGAAGLDSSGAGAAGGLRAADGVHFHLAAGRGTRACRSARRPANRLARHLFNTATTAPPGKEVRVTRHRRSAGATAARSVGALVSSGGRRALGHRRVAHAGVGDFRRGLRGRGGVRFFGAESHAGTGAAGVWPRARGCRPTSARRSAKSDSCAASGWMVRGAWRGWRTTPRR